MQVQNPKTGQTYYLHTVRIKKDGKDKVVRAFWSKEAVLTKKTKDGTTIEYKEEDLPEGFIIKKRLAKDGTEIFPPYIGKQHTPQEEELIKAKKELRRIKKAQQRETRKQRKQKIEKRKALIANKKAELDKLREQINSARKKMKEVKSKYNAQIKALKL